MGSTENKKLMLGSTSIASDVCSGSANYYGLSQGGLQAAFVISSLILGVPLLVYLVLWFILPNTNRVVYNYLGNVATSNNQKYYFVSNHFGWRFTKSSRNITSS